MNWQLFKASTVYIVGPVGPAPSTPPRTPPLRYFGESDCKGVAPLRGSRFLADMPRPRPPAASGPSHATGSASVPVTAAAAASQSGTAASSGSQAVPGPRTHIAFFCINCARLAGGLPVANDTAPIGVTLYGEQLAAMNHARRVRGCKEAGLGVGTVESTVRDTDREVGGTSRPSGGGRAAGRDPPDSMLEDVDRPWRRTGDRTPSGERPSGHRHRHDRQASGHRHRNDRQASGHRHRNDGNSYRADIVPFLARYVIFNAGFPYG